MKLNDFVIEVRKKLEKDLLEVKSISIGRISVAVYVQNFLYGDFESNPEHDYSVRKKLMQNVIDSYFKGKTVKLMFKGKYQNLKLNHIGKTETFGRIIFYFDLED